MELGYWLGEAFWGKGYMTKILHEFLQQVWKEVVHVCCVTILNCAQPLRSHTNQFTSIHVSYSFVLVSKKNNFQQAQAQTQAQQRELK
jgi:hypothetical protein